jgi:hypothetical protein
MLLQPKGIGGLAGRTVTIIARGHAAKTQMDSLNANLPLVD